LLQGRNLTETILTGGDFHLELLYHGFQVLQIGELIFKSGFLVFIIRKLVFLNFIDYCVLEEVRG